MNCWLVVGHCWHGLIENLISQSFSLRQWNLCRSKCWNDWNGDSDEWSIHGIHSNDKMIVGNGDDIDCHVWSNGNGIEWSQRYVCLYQYMLFINIQYIKTQGFMYRARVFCWRVMNRDWWDLALCCLKVRAHCQNNFRVESWRHLRKVSREDALDKIN